MLKRLRTLATHRIHNLPVIVLMPHSRCNCRCVMCDIWKANQEKREISPDALSRHMDAFKKLGVREVVFSGGEALMHADLWKLCAMLKEQKIRITLLSTGLLLKKNAAQIVNFLDEVIVSIDGTEEVHDKIRNVPGGFKKICEGIRELKRLKRDFRITARCVLQRYNFFDFPNIIVTARQICLDQISFLAADVSSSAFNRPQQWSNERVSEVALLPDEVLAFRQIAEQSFTSLTTYYDNGFIAENPAKIRKIVRYYGAVNGQSTHVAPVCNAPWVSAVIESDGSVMPCFFHKPYGNIFDQDLLSILNSEHAITFRKNLRVDKDETCKKCVCSLKLGVAQLN